MSGRKLVDARAAAVMFDVPAQRIYEWKNRKRITEVDSIPGRGRSGRVPLFDPEELRPLVTAYKARTETTRDTPESPG